MDSNGSRVRVRVGARPWGEGGGKGRGHDVDLRCCSCVHSWGCRAGTGASSFQQAEAAKRRRERCH